MFAYKAHSPYDLTPMAGEATPKMIRERLSDLQNYWTVANHLCKHLENSWTGKEGLKSVIVEERAFNESTWFRSALGLVKGEPTLEGYELYEKHIGEMRSKIETLQDISLVILSNL